MTEIFYVQLRRKRISPPISLFRFLGEGSHHTGWTGVLLGDALIDQEGRQFEKARAYADMVAEFTGVPLWQEREVELTIQPVQKFVCPQCGHQTSVARKNCIYCGCREEVRA
ncbi:MAG: hypothetical protein QNJ04_12335 [Desulfobacterales bacterium]|nr:hypothetical protein [Desulfobacterales bacterium]